jgi:REP element-mobilizing transposase RayT
MSEKFQDRYRVKSARLSEYDYSQPGAYFVTICTEDHRPWFGDIVEGRMALSEIGKIVRECWESIPEHFSNIRPDEFVVMPNHLHGIVEILPCRDGACTVSTESEDAKKPPTLSTIVGSFKSACARRIHGAYPDSGFAWQPRFYDHVIRNEESLRSIREYVRKNPTQWQFDEENPENRQ